MKHNCRHLSTLDFRLSSGLCCSIALNALWSAAASDCLGSTPAVRSQTSERQLLAYATFAQRLLLVGSRWITDTRPEESSPSMSMDGYTP